MYIQWFGQSFFKITTKNSLGQELALAIDPFNKNYGLKVPNKFGADIALITHDRIIHILGSAGGGRDVARRQVLGSMAALHDDIVIITNEDPYDESPMQIINDVADAAQREGKKDEIDLFRILDREQAIEFAMGLSQPKDLILITGKGSEPVMAVAHGRKIPWDDRLVARKVLQKRYGST